MINSSNCSFITIGPLIFVNLIVAVVVANLSDSYDQLEKSRRARYRRLQGGDNNSAPVNRMVAELGTVVDEAWEKQIPYEVPVRRE